MFVKTDKDRPRSVGGVLLPAVSNASSTGGTVVEAGDVTLVKVTAAGAVVVMVAVLLPACAEVRACTC